jgi:hypothetical protein
MNGYRSTIAAAVTVASAVVAVPAIVFDRTSFTDGPRRWEARNSWSTSG